VRESIESILAQSYQNWEYTIVNNCSTDNSLAIAQSYAAKDPRIRVHTNQQHVDLVHNHNIAFGMISSESKYCKVVEADDWIFPDCITQMVKVAEAHPSVGIVGSYALHDTNVICDGLAYPSTVTSGRELCRRILLGFPFPLGCPTWILFRSDLVRARRPFYEWTHLFTDIEACFAVLQDTDFGFVHEVLTYSRIHAQTATSSVAEMLNTYALSRLALLSRYGPNHLEAKEYEACLKKHLQQYYTFLGSSFLLRREKVFWNYHMKGMSEFGYPLSRTRVLKAAIQTAMGMLFNPINTLEMVGRRIKRHAKQNDGTYCGMALKQPH
jgi:glycosyltransferase involved in cell wall biosynthesis